MSQQVTLSRRAAFALMAAASSPEAWSRGRTVMVSSEVPWGVVLTTLHGLRHDDGLTPALRAYDLRSGKVMLACHFWHGKACNGPLGQSPL